MVEARGQSGIDIDPHYAQQLLRDNHRDMENALKAYGLHLVELQKAANTTELSSNASSAQSTSETGVRGATGLQRGRLSPKSSKTTAKGTRTEERTESIHESNPRVGWAPAPLSRMQLRQHEKSERFGAYKHYLAEGNKVPTPWFA